MYSFLTPEKYILINLLLTLSKMSFLPLSNSNFHLITLCKLHLCLQPLLLYHFCINFRLMYTCVMLISINWCLLNVIFSMTKAVNDQSSPKQNFYFLHLSMLLEKLCFSLCLFSFFQLYKVSTDPTPVGTSWFVS